MNRSWPSCITRYGIPILRSLLLKSPAHRAHILCINDESICYELSHLVQSIAYKLSTKFRLARFRIGDSRDVLLVGSITGRVSAYDLRTRGPLWTTQGAGTVGFEVAVDGRVAFIPFLSGRLDGVSLETGNRLWQVGSSEEQFLWPPAACGDMLFLAASSSLIGFER